MTQAGPSPQPACCLGLLSVVNYTVGLSGVGQFGPNGSRLEEKGVKGKVGGGSTYFLWGQGSGEGATAISVTTGMCCVGFLASSQHSRRVESFQCLEEVPKLPVYSAYLPE